MPKVIKSGKKEFIGNCSLCGCEFSYTLEELHTKYTPCKSIRCPECGAEYYHPDQSNSSNETLEDYSFKEEIKDSLRVFKQFCSEGERKEDIEIY